MKVRKLGNTDLDVSILSFGASSLGSVFRDISEADGIRTVHEAVDAGINLIDVSPYYGLTKAETVLGKAIKDMDRSRFYLSTKAGRYGDAEFDFSAERLVRSVEESLSRLHTDYIDILYLHDIEFGSMHQIIEESIPALEQLKRQGKIRFSGVSGLPLPVFRTVLAEAQVDSILSYCHYCLNDTTLVQLLPLLKEKGVGLVNASPLAMGLLSGKQPPAWHPASERFVRVCKEAVDYCRSQGADLAKLAIQFSVAHEEIPTTLVSTASPDTIRRNAAWTEEAIDQELLLRVLEMLAPIANQTWPSGRPENNKEAKP
jgi:L-galactose dehydrogenase